jgi:hypothetical protein
MPRELRVNPHFTGNTWARPDAHAGWINQAGEFISNEFGNARMTFWPDGRRASWTDKEKPASRTVYFIGGSYTQGYGVADTETYVYRLNAMYPDVMFHNFGVGGYGTYQSLLKLRELQQAATGGKHADLVIYGYIGDHERRNVATYSWVTALTDTTGRFLAPPHVTVANNALVEHRLEIIQTWPLETRSAFVTLLHEAMLRLRYMDRNTQSRTAANELFVEMNNVARMGGSPFLAVLLNNVEEGLIPFLESRGIAYLDCVNPDFEVDPLYQLGGDGHPSSLQHKLWSDCLAAYLDSEQAFH